MFYLFLVSLFLMAFFHLVELSYSYAFFMIFGMFCSILLFFVVGDIVRDKYEIGKPLWFYVRNCTPFIAAFSFMAISKGMANRKFRCK